MAEIYAERAGIATGAMAGKLCVITGATSGIGRATAEALGALGADLVLVGRNHSAGARLVGQLKRRRTAARVEFIPADLAQQSDVRALAAHIAREYAHIDVLINNAGARFDRYAETAEGIERTFATNHLSHFLLTNLLREQLERATAGRVVTVASGAHASVHGSSPWYLPEARFNRRVAYAKSKLANVMFAYELARRLRGTRVTSNAVDPGGVASNFARNNGLVSWARHLIAHAIRRELVTTRTGAETLVYLAASPEVEGLTGHYFRRNIRVTSSEASHDADEAGRLWALSAQLTGMHEART